MRAVTRPCIDAEVRRRFEAGESYTVIGEALGRSRNSIASICQRLGLYRRGDKTLKRKRCSSPERQQLEADVIRLTKCGYTRREVADKLGTTIDVVQGICRRNGIPGGKKGPRPTTGRASTRSEVQRRLDTGRDPPPDARPCRLHALDARTCRWPLGDSSDPAMLFCGAPAPIDHSYCAAHRERAWS